MSADNFTHQAVASSIRAMFEKNWFDICTIDECLKTLEIKPIASQYQPLRVLHCMHYDKMTPAFREELLIRVMALFSDGTTFDLSVIERGFMIQQVPDVGRVVSIQIDREQKRGFLGLGKRP